MEQWFVESVAARKLQKLSNYREVTHNPAPLTDSLPAIGLRVDEVGVGIYENIRGELTDCILVTNVGLHVRFESQWLVVDYEDIQSVRGPETKEEISGVTLVLSDGRDIAIPVRGARSQFRDAFSFQQFLRAIMIRRRPVKNQ